jgi:hypothetical protein
MDVVGLPLSPLASAFGFLVCPEDDDCDGCWATDILLVVGVLLLLLLLLG